MSRYLEYSSIKPKISIILASGSASRKMMLEEAGIVFDVIVSETDEDLIKKKLLKALNFYQTKNIISIVEFVFLKTMNLYGNIQKQLN